MPLAKLASFESDKYNSIPGNFIILIIDASNVTIQNFKFSNSNHGWLQLSSLITGWICWKFYDIDRPLDLSKGVHKRELEARRFTQKEFTSHRYFAILNWYIKQF